MNKYKVLVTLLNMAMFVGFKVMIKSFLKNNEWFDQRIVILDINLTEDAKQEIGKIYPDTVFVGVNFNNYNNVNFRATHPRLQCTYFKLDMFSLYDYDRVVFIDSDTVIIGDISDLFNLPVPCIGGVKGYNEKNDVLGDGINSGVVVVPDNYLTKEVYQKLIKISSGGFAMPDQKTINIMFRGKITYFDKIYNVEKRMEYTNKYKHVLQDMRIVHYVAGKPWQKDDPEKGKYPTMERLWHIWKDITEKV